MNVIAGIFESIVAAIIVGLGGWLWKRSVDRRIKITEPKQHGLLLPAEKIREVMAHRVSGTLKHLPKDHSIWLSVVDEGKGVVYPQGFEPVEYDELRGTWKGYVHVWGWNNVTIVAVVAPPTSQDYFHYYQRMGREFKTNYQPLKRIPPECKQRATVQVRVPKVEIPQVTVPEAKP